MITIMEYKKMLNDSTVSDKELRASWKDNPRNKQLYYERKKPRFEEVSAFDFELACEQARMAMEEVLREES